jgi:hypothetical protein
MTDFSSSADLPTIASEAQVEIVVAETIQESGPRSDDADHAFDGSELGYYEAELRSLRDAAISLDEAEQQR